MREILHRAKTRDRKEWLYGYYVRLNDKAVIVLKEATDRFDWERKEMLKSHDMILIDAETVCQYTGLTDKNGNRIFEGDIVSTHGCKGNVSMNTDYWEIHWNNNFERSLYVWANTVEVIGNIFDNPELIGEQP